jgi:hypothetical protein
VLGILLKGEVRMEEVGEEKGEFPWLPPHGKIPGTREEMKQSLELPVHPSAFSRSRVL